ncbi:Flp pilus assembly complex ATPase component TadA, partial [Patescibacteria group bacterium]|nr:Flp pilus assembly complex ATPase component TadA [Patescibacteria group bacterium]
MPLTDDAIGTILLEQSYVSEEELKKALERSKETKASLLNILMDQGLLTQQLFESALAEHYKLAFYDVQTNPPPSNTITLLPEEIARAYSVIVVKKEGSNITVATSDPSNETLEEAIRLNLEQEEAVIPEGEESEPVEDEGAIDKDIGQRTADSGEEASASAKATTDKKDDTEGREGSTSAPDGATADRQESQEGSKEKDESESDNKPTATKAEPEQGYLPVEDKKKKSKGFSFSFGKKKPEKAERKKFTGEITFVYCPKASIDSIFKHYQKPLATRFQQIIDQEQKVAPEILEEILDDAIQLRASDIHFEPQEKIVIVRFRVDGVMHEAGRIPKEHYEGVLNRIKIDGNMRIDEHFSAQDGAIRHKTSVGPIDIRVSIVPIVDGEKVVMRILAEYVRHLTMTDLGFTQTNQEILTRASNKPFGMILTTGPTGSGKSTTLYALVKIRNAPDVNISTIEDPVEYKIAGINHIQVNNKAELTFAKGLRALVRQDPDILLVGEIRDGETADISVNAALTGHLLFSTLHANDAATAIPRLLDMDVEPFLLASTLEVIIGQR